MPVERIYLETGQNPYLFLQLFNRDEASACIMHEAPYPEGRPVSNPAALYVRASVINTFQLTERCHCPVKAFIPGCRDNN